VLLDFVLIVFCLIVLLGCAVRVCFDCILLEYVLMNCFLLDCVVRLCCDCILLDCVVRLPC
jgi:hypothetical protein